MTESENAKLKKISAYVGFSIKAGKVIYGVDYILVSKKVKLIFASENLGRSGLNKLIKYAEDSQVRIIYRDVEELTRKINCKAIGITHRGLAEAITKVLNEDNKEIEA